MKVSELKQKSLKELDGLLSELYRTQFNLRMQKASGQLTKLHEIKDARRNVARVMTARKQIESNR